MTNNPFSTEALKVWEDAEKAAPEAAQEAAEAAQATFVARAQQRAERAAWPKETLRQIQPMRDKDGGYVVGVPDGVHGDRARDLEYGTEKFGPQAVLRKTVKKSKKEISEVVQTTLVERLFGDA
jgi:HK97 gp10 family phage protein